MAENQVVSMFLWQSLGQHLESGAAVACPRNNDAAAHRDAPLILLGGCEPSRVRIARVDSDAKAERRGLRVLDLAPRSGAVSSAKDAVVVLHPQGIRLGGALDQAMTVLDVGVELAVRRHVLGAHAVRPALPGSALVAGPPDAPTRDAYPDAAAVARVNAN